MIADKVRRVIRMPAGRSKKYIIGIDEVGRGALAGPVVVSAAAVPDKWKVRNKKLKEPLRDSKKLSLRQRHLWLEYIRNERIIFYACARVYPRKIERLNISQAANLAALRALRRLAANCGFTLATCRVYLDGGLHVGNKARSVQLGVEAHTVVRGDEKINAIKIASIVAKVERDRFMVSLGKKYPEYGFEFHKGYGTEKHIRAIRRHGPSAAHRATFITYLTRKHWPNTP